MSELSLAGAIMRDSKQADHPTIVGQACFSLSAASGAANARA
jgi:hypothetical protein